MSSLSLSLHLASLLVVYHTANICISNLAFARFQQQQKKRPLGKMQKFDAFQSQNFGAFQSQKLSQIQYFPNQLITQKLSQIT